MTPVAVARAGRSARNEIVVDPRSRGDERLGERAYLPVVVVGLASAVLAIILFVLKGSTPIWDDGTEILPRMAALPGSAFLPYHQHLNAVPILLWAILPGAAAKLGALLVVHVALTAATAAFLLTRLGPHRAWLALPLGLMGSAHYDLLVPWQILFPLALLFGLAAVWASVDRRRTPLRATVVAVGLLLSAATSNVGLFVILALGVWFVLERRWLQLVELVPAGVAWGVWYLLLGRIEAVAIDPSWLVVPYTAVGIAKSIGGVLGVGTILGAAAVVLGLVYAIRNRPAAPLIGFAVAVVTMFAVLSAVRSPATVFTDVPAASRYTYIVGFLVAFALAAAAPRIRTTRWLVPAAVAASALNLVALALALPSYP